MNSKALLFREADAKLVLKDYRSRSVQTLFGPLIIRVPASTGDYGGSAWGEGNDSAPAQEVVREIAAARGMAAADASNWGDAQGLIARTVEHFGGLDILVNNVGIRRPTKFGELSENIWDRIVDINAKSMAALIDAAAGHWREIGPKAGRAVVCTASCSGSNPHFPLGIYGVSKAAVLAIAQVAAQKFCAVGGPGQCAGSYGTHPDGDRRDARLP